MEIATVKAETRTRGGRTTLTRLRKRGMMPAVIYGHKQDPEIVAIPLHDFERAMEHHVHVLNVDIGGKQQQYLIKDIQYDHLQKTPIHVDFMRVDASERVSVKVPIELRGEPHGLHEGGVLVQLINELDVECPLLGIPDMLRPMVDHLGVGEALHVKDLELPEGVTAINKPDDVVAAVQIKRIVEEEEVAAAVEEVEGEGASEPEVIGRVAKEEGEGGATS